MNRLQNTRTFVLGSVIVLCAFAFQPTTAAPATDTTVTSLTPQSLGSIDALQAGQLTKAACDDAFEAIPCLTVPVAATGTDEFGNRQTVVAQYAVGPDMVARISDDFRDVSDVVLRNLRPVIASGTKAADHGTRLACKQSIVAVDRNVKYKISPGVRMPVKVESAVAQIAKRVAPVIGRPVVVTSGNRTPVAQADAMRNKIALGDNIVRLYANKKAAKEVLYAYKSAKVAGASKQGITQRIADVIQSQVDQGVFLSDHMRDGAVDIRTRDLSGWQRKQLLYAAQNTPGVQQVILESTPPHLHVEVQ